MTKAEEKIKNIKAAIGVFEDWIEKNAGSSSSKTPKKSDGDKIETVPGLGFKDKETADKTLKYMIKFEFIFQISCFISRAIHIQL